MTNRGQTLAEFVLEHQGTSQISTEFSLLLSQIAFAARTIAAEIGLVALTGITGPTSQVNAQGKEPKKLDQLSNDIFLKVMEGSRLVCQVVSEEMEEVYRIGKTCVGRRYSVLVDPLDRSSNADINGSVGTIFSIHRRRDPMAADSSKEEVLQKGSKQVAAGYILYGPSTILVYTSGEGVNGFTLEPESQRFLLSHQDLRIPPRGKTYSINHGNRSYWHPWTSRFVDHLTQSDESNHRPSSLRWVGSLPADFHRILLEGGVYLYPDDGKRPQGKLRLLYECAPLAFLAEQAGGAASTGSNPILELQPTGLHQRTPLIIGSKEDVELAERFASQ